MTTFTDLGVDATREAQLASQGILEPTPIQALAIPLLLAGSDVLIHAQTGSGKTLAYLLPLLARLAKETPPDAVGPAAPNALILVPTQELGMQVYGVAKTLMAVDGWEVVSLIGGANPARQAEALRKRPRLIVGTPGRVLQFFREDRLVGKSIRVLVGDEADQLFELAHRADLGEIFKATSPSRQTVFVTATTGSATDAMPDWAKKSLRDGQIVKVPDELKLPPSLVHQAFIVDPREKVELVRRLMRHLNPIGAIAFVNRPADADWWVAKLKHHGLRAAALHSGVQKLERASTMRDFRSGKLQLLLATELASRGLDLGGVSLIVNMELPTDAWHYVHRVGRTARMGRAGTAVTLVTPPEAFVLGKIEKALGMTFERPVLQGGEVREATPADIAKQEQRTAHTVKKDKEKAVVVAKNEARLEAGEHVRKPKKSKVKGPTDKALAKGKAKKAKKKEQTAAKQRRLGIKPGATKAAGAATGAAETAPSAPTAD